MRTKIIIEDCVDESYSIELTLKEIFALFKILKKANYSEITLFGEERYNELYKKLGNFSNIYSIEHELEQEYKKPIMARFRRRV